MIHIVCLFIYLFMGFCFVLFCFSAAPEAYGNSQARDRIGAIAAGPHHSHSNPGSELRLQPTPQLTATPDPSPTEQRQGSNLQPHCSQICQPLRHDGNFHTYLLDKVNHDINFFQFRFILRTRMLPPRQKQFHCYFDYKINLYPLSKEQRRKNYLKQCCQNTFWNNDSVVYLHCPMGAHA